MDLSDLLGIAAAERAEIVAGHRKEETGAGPDGIVAEIEDQVRPQRAEQHPPGRKAEDPLVDSGEHVFDRPRAESELLVAELVRNARGERCAPGQVDSELCRVLRLVVGRLEGPLMDQVDARAQRVGEPVQPRRGETQVDGALDRDPRRKHVARLALRHVGGAYRADPGLEAGKGEVGFAHRREGEVAPEDVALGPLQRDARAVGEREAHAGLEVPRRPFPELDLEGLLALRDLGIARRQRGGEEQARAEQQLLAPFDRLRGEQVAPLEAHQVQNQRLEGAPVSHHLDVPDPDERTRLDPVADVHPRDAVLRVLEILLVLDPGVEVAAPGEDLRQCRPALLRLQEAEWPPAAKDDGRVQLGARHVPSPLHQDPGHPGLLALLDGNGDLDAARVPTDGLQARRSHPDREVALRLVEVFHLPQRARVHHRIEDRLGIHGDAGRAGPSDPPGQPGQLQRLRIRGDGGIARDGVAQEQQDAFLELPGGDRLVSADHQPLDAQLQALVDGEHHLFGAIAGDHRSLGHPRAEEPGRDVEAAQATRQLLRSLGVERIVGVENEVGGQHGVGEGPVPAQVEAHQRTRGHRDHDARLVPACPLDAGRVDAGAQPSRPPVALADPAKGLVERDQVQHVALLEPEGRGELVAVERQVPLEPDLRNARRRALVDAKLERQTARRRLAHRRDLRVPVPDAEVRGLHRLDGRPHLLRLELRVHLEVRVLQQHALGEGPLSAEADRDQFLDPREHEHQPHPPVVHGFRVRGHAGEAGARVQRTHGVAYVASIQHLAGLHLHQRADGLRVRAFEHDLPHPQWLQVRRLREEERTEDAEQPNRPPISGGGRARSRCRCRWCCARCPAGSGPRSSPRAGSRPRRGTGASSGPA